MKKIIATAEGLDGEVHFVYDDNGMLLTLDFAHAELDEKQRNWFLERTPVLYSNNLPHAFGTNKLTFVSADYRISFDMFWEKYNKKFNKKRCEPLWNKLTKTKQVKAYYGISSYDKHLIKNPWKTKADPETYLRKEYWENDWRNI